MPPIEIERKEFDDRIQIYLTQPIDEHTNRVISLEYYYKLGFWFISVLLPGDSWMNYLQLTLQGGQEESFYIELAKGLMTLRRFSLDAELRA